MEQTSYAEFRPTRDLPDYVLVKFCTEHLVPLTTNTFQNFRNIEFAMCQSAYKGTWSKDKLFH